jgi:hypothetical protein
MPARIVQDTNFAGLQALAKRLRAGTASVLVGVPAGKTEADGTSIAEIAAWNEFGTATAPERPAFRRLGEARHRADFIRLNAANLIRIAEGRMTEEAALGQLGAVAAGKVKQEIADGDFVPNAPSTIAAKGSSKPLIDSGQLRQSITWELDHGQAGPGIIR